MSDKPSTLAAGLFVTVGVLALMPVMVIWSGFCLETLWNWYATPFTPIKLSLAEAVGLSALVTIVKGYKRTPDTDEEDGSAKDLLFAVFMPGFLLLVGWGAHLFMAHAQ